MEDDMMDDEFVAAFEGTEEDVPMIEAQEESASTDDVKPEEDGADVTNGTEPAASTVDPVEEGEEEPTDPKEIQRMKSWEGRMKAREAELAKREAELNARMSSVTPVTDTPTESPEEEAMEEAVEKLQEGDSVDSVLAEMAEDFGDDFVRKLGTLIEKKAAQIASKAVDDNVTKVRQEFDDFKTASMDRATRAHFEAIGEKHPDFIDMIAENGPLDQYIQGLPADQQADAMRIRKGGSTRESIRLLDQVKASMQKPEQEDNTEKLSAAEGVRSRGLKLPEKPASEDYAAAWDSF